MRLTAAGSTLLQQDLTAYRQAVGISQTVALLAGDVMSCEVSAGPNSYGNDSVALRVRITPLP